MVKRRITTALLIASVALNLILAAIAGNLWLQKRARDLGLPSSSEALRSLAGASVLPSVRIEFRVAEEQPGTGLTPVATNDYPPTLYLHSDVAVSNGDIHGAKAGRDDLGLPTVTLELTEAGAAKLQAVTSANLQKRLAILADGKVLLAPIIQSAVTDRSVEIAGELGDTDVQRIVLAFQRR